MEGGRWRGWLAGLRFTGIVSFNQLYEFLPGKQIDGFRSV